MKLESILTDRDHETRSFYQIVFEWEEDFSRELKLPLRPRQPGSERHKLLRGLVGKYHLYRPLQWLDQLKGKRGKAVYFDMGPRWTYNNATTSTVVPILIDFWKYIDIPRFTKVYRNCPLVCISSLEAFRHLKESGCPLPLAWLPLSLPDKYRIEISKPFAKDIDIVSVGRSNPVLQGFLDRFLERHPGVSYVIQRFENGRAFYGVRGVAQPEGLESREGYLQLIRRSRVSFYATPGIDGGESRTGGFNPVTPRLFELLYAGCRLVGRYPDTEETRFFELEQVCPTVEDYDQFEQRVEGYLAEKEQPLRFNDHYLQKHYTSKRARQFQELLTKSQQ